jgi:DNA-binding MarR family transcriptional regulator
MASQQAGISDQQVRHFRAQQRRLLRLMLAISRFHQRATGMGSLELHILQMLAERLRTGGDDPIARDLAAELKVDKAALSRAVAALAKKGLVEAETAAQDGRQQHLRLTESGKESARELDETAQAGNRMILERLPAGDREGLMRALDAYIELVSRAMEENEREIGQRKRGRPKVEG